MKKRDMNRDWIATARTLSEALPYLQRYDDAIVVIKLGGHAMGSDAAMDEFARDVVLMRQVGVNPVIVHGGGPMINAMLERLQIILGIRARQARDRRGHDGCGGNGAVGRVVNKRIVQAINRQGGAPWVCRARMQRLITCVPSDPELGLVGEPDAVDPAILRTLFRDDTIPVIAPLGAGRAGETFNINGDTAAGAIAGALKADRLLLLTDVEGVKDAAAMSDRTDLDPDRRDDRDGRIAGGMIPKTETALKAIADGVRAVVILDGRAPNAVLLELFTEHGAGSIIRAG
jgi:acetylglutamate kinase